MNQDQFRSQCLKALGITPWRMNGEYEETQVVALAESVEATWCLLGADPDSPLLQDLLLLLQCRREEVTMIEPGHRLSQGQRLLSFGGEHGELALSLPLWSELETAKGKRQAWKVLQERL